MYAGYLKIAGLCLTALVVAMLLFVQGTRDVSGRTVLEQVTSETSTALSPTPTVTSTPGDQNKASTNDWTARNVIVLVSLVAVIGLTGLLVLLIYLWRINELP